MARPSMNVWPTREMSCVRLTTIRISIALISSSVSSLSPASASRMFLIELLNHPVRLLRPFSFGNGSGVCFAALPCANVKSIESGAAIGDGDSGTRGSMSRDKWDQKKKSQS